MHYVMEKYRSDGLFTELCVADSREVDVQPGKIQKRRRYQAYFSLIALHIWALLM